LSFAYTGISNQPPGYSAAIKINSLGFLPNAEKRASISTNCSGNFYVKKSSGGSTAYTGTLSRAVRNDDTDEDLITADFSALTTSGTYYVEVPNVGRTQEFIVNSKAYNWPFYMTMKGLYLFRCGTAVSWTDPWAGNTTFSHAACHSAAEMARAGNGVPAMDVTGGHHDANDCNKYVVPASFSSYLLMKACTDFNLSNVKLDIPESPERIPDMMAEARWELISLLKFQ
jgi:endoglucanase